MRDESDLDPENFESKMSQDLTSLVRKRKLQYEEENNDVKASTDNMHKTAQVGSVNLLLDGPFSASSALDNFLEIRSSKKQTPIRSTYFTGPSTPGQTTNHSPAELNLPTQPHVTKRPLPVPSTNIPSTLVRYIISSVILKRRPLIRKLNALIPTAVFVERDFTAHNTTTWMPNSVTRSPIAASLDSEADFIISPSTGIILTSLQKIKQRPLPGQKAKSAFKVRIEKASARYDRLVVLVSEACADESTSGLAESDTLALVEAIGFCSSLGGSVILQYIGGGEETLAHWIVATMVLYGSRGESSVVLLEDETLWELFLRRAGMNAYAAQAVIAELKVPDGVDMEGGSKVGTFGVAAFVEMEQEERVARFEPLLGGQQVLQRVGKVLDADWP